MIERAHDSLDTDIDQSLSTSTESTPAVTPDSAKTQEVAEQHANFEVVSNVAVAHTDTPDVTEDGIRTTPIPGSAEPVEVKAERFATSHVSAYSDEAPQTIDSSLIGAHDASAKIDSFSPTLYAPQPVDEDAAALARANALHPEDNRTDDVLDAVAQQRVAQVGHAPGVERQQQGKRRDRPNRAAPQGEQRRAQLPPASKESLERLKDFGRVRTENSVRNFSKKQAEARDRREQGKNAGLPQDKKSQKPQAEARPAPQVPALVRSERTVNFLKEAMSDRDMSLRDGVDHINSSAEGRTKLGRLLDTNAYAPFHHPDLGAFNSLSGLWYFITGVVSDEAFRDLHGTACQRRGSVMEKRHVPGLRGIIAEATFFKVTQHEKLGKLMAANTLPFRCYFMRGEGVSRSPRLQEIEHWYMPVLDEIGRVMREFHNEGKQDATPNFDFLQGAAVQQRREPQPRREPREQRPRQQQERRERHG